MSDAHLTWACLVAEAHQVPDEWLAIRQQWPAFRAWSGVRTIRGSLADVPAFLLEGRLESESSAPPSSYWVGSQITPPRARAPFDPSGLLINMMSVPAEHEEELNTWYETEHLPRITAVDGVISSRRFRVLRGEISYAAVYELSDIDLPGKPVWREAATTEWTTRIQSLRTRGARFLMSRMTTQDQN